MSKFEHKQHMRLWDYLTRTGEVMKEIWPEWMDIENKFYRPARCFACGPSHRRIEKIETIATIESKKCSLCPINWGGYREVAVDADAVEACPCEYEDTLYIHWLRAKSPTERSHYAALIRDIEWTEKGT